MPDSPEEKLIRARLLERVEGSDHCIRTFALSQTG
jgi:hypothetical protein